MHEQDVKYRIDLEDGIFDFGLIEESELMQKAEAIEGLVGQGRLTRIQGDTLGKAWDMIIVEYEAAAAVGESVQIFIRRTPAEDDGYSSIAAVGNYRPDQI